MKTTASVSILIASLFLTSTTPAEAAVPASITRTIYLDGSGVGSATVPYGSPRTIYLAAGTYTWTERLGGVGPNRDIYLAAADYDWSCVQVGNGNGTVDTRCALVRHNSTSSTVYLPYGGDYTISLSGSGDYVWTSQLTPH